MFSLVLNVGRVISLKVETRFTVRFSSFDDERGAPSKAWGRGTLLGNVLQILITI